VLLLPTGAVLVLQLRRKLRPGEHRISEFEEFKGEKKKLLRLLVRAGISYGKQTASGENFNMLL